MQNLYERMHKVGKWLMILEIACVFSLLVIEWSRWNLLPLSTKFNLILAQANLYEVKTQFIEGVIATIGIFSLFAAPSLLRWDNKSIVNVILLLLSIFLDICGSLSVIARGEIFTFYVLIILFSMLVYVKITIEILQKIYTWITAQTNNNHYDIAKMTFVWAIIAFILGKIW